jgi:hypothetical protein
MLTFILGPDWPQAPVARLAQPPNAAKPRMSDNPLEQAIFEKLGGAGEPPVPIWTIINHIAEEQEPRSRAEGRSLRAELLQIVRELVRSGRLRRVRRTMLRVSTSCT